jgi:hypothetical protein
MLRAYADMLQVVGNGVNVYETRSHFGWWEIVSSPLILNHDVHNDTVMETLWDIISNREVVLAINQVYAGDSGGANRSATNTAALQSPDENEVFSCEVPVYQYLSKPTGSGEVAVLLMNSDDENTELVASFADIPGIYCDDMDEACDYHVRDAWNHEDLGIFRSSLSVSAKIHDAAFLLLAEREAYKIQEVGMYDANLQ